MDWLKKAPTSVVITVVIVVGGLMLTALGGFILLTYNGKDTTDFRLVINSVMIYVATALSGVGAVAAVGAAKSSAKTEDQTNGATSAERDAIARAAAAHAIAAYRKSGGA